MAESGFTEFAGVALGGALALGSAYLLEKWKWRRDAVRENRQVQRLIDVLYIEIEQIAEPLAIDLNIIVNLPHDEIVAIGLRHSSERATLLGKIQRIRQLRTVFDSYASRLLELPGMLPNQMVSFHARFQVNCDGMTTALEEGDIERFEELRESCLLQAEVLKTDLRNARIA